MMRKLKWHVLDLIIGLVIAFLIMNITVFFKYVVIPAICIGIPVYIIYVSHTDKGVF